jgi:hypothetical protein
MGPKLSTTENGREEIDRVVGEAQWSLHLEWEVTVQMGQVLEERQTQETAEVQTRVTVDAKETVLGAG